MRLAAPKPEVGRNCPGTSPIVPAISLACAKAAFVSGGGAPRTLNVYGRLSSNVIAKAVAPWCHPVPGIVRARFQDGQWLRKAERCNARAPAFPHHFNRRFVQTGLRKW